MSPIDNEYEAIARAMRRHPDRSACCANEKHSLCLGPGALPSCGCQCHEDKR